MTMTNSRPLTELTEARCLAEGVSVTIADASGITLEEAFAGIGMKVEWRPKETT